MTDAIQLPGEQWEPSNATDGDKIFPSINKAKRESRAIQTANGGLGCGVLRVVERLPLFDQIN